MEFDKTELEKYSSFIDELSKELNIKSEYIKVEVDTSPDYHYLPLHRINIGKLGIFLCIVGSPTGCGLCTMSGFVNTAFSERKALKTTLELFEKNFLKKFGCIMATLGESYFNQKRDEMLKIMGFNEVTSFTNPNMDNKFQKIYFKYINQVESTEPVKATTDYNVLSEPALTGESSDGKF